jgi:hypothetical protein
MSNTKHHRNQRSQKSGCDFGSRRPGNEGYSAGTGPYAKSRTHRMERAQAKEIVSKEVGDYRCELS